MNWKSGTQCPEVDEPSGQQTLRKPAASDNTHCHSQFCGSGIKWAERDAMLWGPQAESRASWQDALGTNPLPLSLEWLAKSSSVQLNAGVPEFVAAGPGASLSHFLLSAHHAPSSEPLESFPCLQPLGSSVTIQEKLFCPNVHMTTADPPSSARQLS